MSSVSKQANEESHPPQGGRWLKVDDQPLAGGLDSAGVEADVVVLVEKLTEFAIDFRVRISGISPRSIEFKADVHPVAQEMISGQARSADVVKTECNCRSVTEDISQKIRQRPNSGVKIGGRFKDFGPVNAHSRHQISLSVDGAPNSAGVGTSDSTERVQTPDSPETKVSLVGEAAEGIGFGARSNADRPVSIEQAISEAEAELKRVRVKYDFAAQTLAHEVILGGNHVGQRQDYLVARDQYMAAFGTVENLRKLLEEVPSASKDEGNTSGNPYANEGTFLLIPDETNLEAVIAALNGKDASGSPEMKVPSAAATAEGDETKIQTAK